MNNMTQNQTVFFRADESSKPNKKYSIPTVVIPAPNTPRKKSVFSPWSRNGELGRRSRLTAIIIPNSASEKTAPIR